MDQSAIPGLDPEIAGGLETGATLVSFVQKRHHPGGGLNAIHICSSKAAAAIVVRSPWIGPAICTPIGRPALVNPIGATVAGKWKPPVRPGQNSRSL